MADNQNMYDRFSNNVLHMIVFAKAASIDANVDCIYPESFMIGILLTGENVVTSTLLAHDVNLEICIKKFKTKLAKRQKDNSKQELTYDELQISKEVVEVCKRANEISQQNQHTFIGLGHIFIAAMELHVDLRSIMSKECKDFKACLAEIMNSKVNKSTKSNSKKEVTTAPNAIKSDNESVLEQFCVNMTDKANKNEFDPIIARDPEIEEAITILCRRTKSNPLLVGEAGVGKTAIVEGISQRIISGTVPKKLLNCSIYSLNLSSMVAGTKYRGDFEKRIQDLIKIVEDDPKCILFIDEIHTIVGAGGAGGSLDAANILKPALARNMRCIGACTFQDYKRHFQDDGALSRRFGMVTIEEPSDEDVKKILMGIKDRFEKYHECSISTSALDSIISLTKRYRPTKHFPDKAIDCLDTACAKYAWNTSDIKPVIISNDIAMVISKQCQVPLEVILWDSYERIKKIEEFLGSRIIGQEQAIENISRVLRNAYSGVRNPSRPIGVLVFGGQSGTGKTYTAKEMSKAIFGNYTSFIRVDMTEYSEKHSVSKIIGSPPGYVGFKDVDVVVDKIKRHPYCIVLLDEVEKAHPDIMRLFLQVMSEGVITSATGEKIDCKNIFFIMTGNFGMNVSKSQHIGFNGDNKTAVENEKERLIDFCKKRYGEEFVNRIDEFIPFMPLSKDNLSKIISMRLNEFSERIINDDVKIQINENVANFLVNDNSLEHGMNAMVLDRIISKKIEPLVADSILMLNDQQYKYIITIDIKDNMLFVKTTKRKRYQSKK